VHNKNIRRCKGVTITINGVSNNFFIDKEDVQKLIRRHAGEPTGKPVSGFNLEQIERALEKDIWIKNAELFFDNNEHLQAIIDEREPVARVFTTSGNTFYIDNSMMMLPLSEKFSARLPVFTGFPSEAKVLVPADSNLLKDIKMLSNAIQEEPFLMAMIEQVDITAQRRFEMIPKFGNQLIIFGDGKDAQQKFKKLGLFYKKVMTKAGWSRYSIINLQYKDQVVAKIRDTNDVSADSLRTLQIMQLIAANAERAASDSMQIIIQDSEKNTADSSLIQQSLQREEYRSSNSNEEPLPQGKTKALPVLNSNPPAATSNPNPNPSQKPTSVILSHGEGPKSTNAKQIIKPKPVKPKVVMPANDYN
jgi:cell division protein FtsQ